MGRMNGVGAKLEGDSCLACYPANACPRGLSSSTRDGQLPRAVGGTEYLGQREKIA